MTKVSSRPNPFLSIWTKPRWTFDHFFQARNGDSLYGWPFLIYGIYTAIAIGKDVALLFDRDPSPVTRLGATIFITLFNTGVFLLVLGKIYPWIIQKIGKLWEGKASINQLGTVHAMAIIPYTLELVYQLILIALDLEGSENPYHALLSYIIWILNIRIIIIGISKAQKFSYGLALLNAVLAYLPVFLLQIWLSSIKNL
ncbi:hypothetical protein [Marinoscillum sp.]|uniref:hypothetical protein n=1 Tax=Marinoscillum sp. TaxID=2024838 RepID=UPI003BABE42B